MSGPSGVRSRGMALLVVLWGCTLAAITLGALAANARIEGLQAQAQSRRAIAFYAAEAGVEQAAYRRFVVDPGNRWNADGALHTFRIGDAEVTLSMVAEDGKINLNSATPEIIEGLLRAAGVEDERIATARKAIVDWGASGRIDDSLLMKGGFSSLEELRRVPGLAPDIVALIEPGLTLWGSDAPNLAYASPLVVSAVTGADMATSRNFVQQVRSVLSEQTTLPSPPGPRMGYVARGPSTGIDVVSTARVAGGPSITLDVVILPKRDPASRRAYRVVRWKESSSLNQE